MIRHLLNLSLSFLAFALVACGQRSVDNAFVVPYTADADWETGFKNPPDEARGRVYWWWLEGLMSRQGVVDDLTAMQKAGIRGAVVFDAGSSGYYRGGQLTYHNQVYQTPSGPGFMSDEWRDLFAYSCRVADSLGIELSLSITSGWNDGGPWVTPDLASQKLVWSETEVNGGRDIALQLPLPKEMFKPKDADKPYFRPVAVLALKLTPEADSLQALPLFAVKAVHSIHVPYRADGLGHDWESVLPPAVDTLKGCTAYLNDVIDLTDKTDADGNLRWDAPAGRFVIMRFGHTGTGVQVSTHSPGAGGLAIDYMNAKALDLQFAKVVTPVLSDLERLGGRKALRYFHDDSWELGAANWTPAMEKSFKEMNSYEIRKYLPVIAGKIIESYDVSERFLYDFRRTIADLIWQNHYVRFRELAHEQGIGLHPEAGGPHPAPIDALKNLGECDIPMGEFWTIANTHRVEPHRRLYVKQSASAAHIYGKRFNQAEGATSIGPHWERDPWLLKPTFDRVFCEGLTRVVFHTFTHSPREAGLPGNEYFAGTHFNQNVTWWPQAKAFIDWTSRNSFMLSRGLFVADVAFYYGDNTPNQVPLKHIDPRLGAGYDYDVVNSDVIINRMTVCDGRLCLPDGMSYRVLALPERNAVNLDVLERIEALVKAGATVVGEKPTCAVGLRGGKQANERVTAIANRLWKGANDASTTENTYGKGKVVWGKSIRAVLQAEKVLPDFDYSGKREPDSMMIDFIHRQDGVRHIYYVDNRNKHAEWLRCTFRVGGMLPELWYPETGEIVEASVYCVDADGRLSMPLWLDPWGSVFVVFRRPNTLQPVTRLSLNNIELFPDPQIVPEHNPLAYMPDGGLVLTQSGDYTMRVATQMADIHLSLPESRAINAPWQLSFDPKWGAPANTTVNKLTSWTESPVADVKYYSGAAVYRNHFNVTEAEIQHYRITLDLGELHNLAELSINGKEVGVLWKRPFSADVTEWLHAGDNTFELTVVNLWPNRIIGDLFLPEDKRHTHTNVAKFTKDTPLLPSGLLGPVMLNFSQKVR